MPPNGSCSPPSWSAAAPCSPGPAGAAAGRPTHPPTRSVPHDPSSTDVHVLSVRARHGGSGAGSGPGRGRRRPRPSLRRLLAGHAPGESDHGDLARRPSLRCPAGGHLAGRRRAGAPAPRGPAGAAATFRRDLTAAVREVVKPAFTRYRDVLRASIMAAARPPAKAGLSFLPGGADDYRRQIRIQTSLDLTPDTLHQLGLEQVARFRHDLSELGQKALGTGD